MIVPSISFMRTPNEPCPMNKRRQRPMFSVGLCRWEVVGSEDGIQYGPFPVPLHGLPARFWKEFPSPGLCECAWKNSLIDNDSSLGCLTSIIYFWSFLPMSSLSPFPFEEKRKRNRVQYSTLLVQFFNFICGHTPPKTLGKMLDFI